MSERHTAARQTYWRNMDPLTKSQRMRDLALIRQKQMTKKQKRDHALKMVAARKAKKV